MTCRSAKPGALGQVGQGEQELAHSAALAWLIKERQNVTDAKVWRYAQRAELERTIRAKTRERQKLEDNFCEAADKYNEHLGCDLKKKKPH